MEKNKVILWRADSAGCGWARIDLISKYLNRKYSDIFNTEPSQVMNPQDWVTFDDKGVVKEIKYKLAVLQRQYGTPNLQNMFFLQDKLKVPCIYEIDDFLHGVHRLSSAHYAYNTETQKDRFANIDSFLQKSTAVTVTTEYLKKMYSKYNKEIYVLPNSIDFEIYQDTILTLREIERLKHKQNGEIWLGWAGSNTHLPDLLQAKDAVIQILRDFPQVKLALGGWDGSFHDKEGNIIAHELNPWKDIPANRKVVIPWATDMKDYPKMLINFDIGIAPLEDNTFNRCKSNIKFLEYSACGVPVIASDVDPYSNTITEGETGLLVKTKGCVFSDWYKKIKRLVLDEQLRLKLAENATSLVKRGFNIEKNIDQWKDVYLDIIRRGVNK